MDQGVGQKSNNIKHSGFIPKSEVDEMRLKDWVRFWKWLLYVHRDLQYLALSPYDTDYEDYLENMRKYWMKREGFEYSEFY